MNVQDDYTRITLRIPPELAGELKAAAKNSGSSVNAKIISLLSEGLRKKDRKLKDASCSIKDAANDIMHMAKWINMLVDDKDGDNLKSKEFFLNKEEVKLINWFSTISEKERKLLLSSIPNLLPLIAEISNINSPE